MILSIVVPVYNKEKYLPQCIKSLLSIKNISYEIILIDDGSQDNSLNICHMFSEKYKNILTIHQANQGVSIARNTGIAKAKGKYITFIDADDFVQPFYEKQLEKALKIKADYYQFNYTRWIDDKHKASGNQILDEGYYSNIRLLIKQIAGLEIPVMSVCCGVYRLDIIKNNNLKFCRGVKTCEDFLFNIQYIKKIHNFYISNGAAYCYRYNSKSVTMIRPLSHADDYDLIYKVAGSYIVEHDASDDEKRLFQRRWIRWTIDLINNWKNQGFSHDIIWKYLDNKYFYNMICKKEMRQDIPMMIEQKLLKKHKDKQIFIYCLIIQKVKKILGKYEL